MASQRYDYSEDSPSLMPSLDDIERDEREGDRIQDERAQRITDDLQGSPLSDEERSHLLRRMPLAKVPA